MMYRPFFTYDFDENNTSREDVMINEPRQCMHCNETGVQNFIVGMKTNGQYDNFHSLGLYTCPLCASTTIHFLSRWDEPDIDFSNPTYSTFETIPAKKEKLEAISNDLQNQFPDFFYIYFQSEKAEEYGLDKIAGMGYRKALEFLVTDYLLAYPVDGADSEWLTNPKTTLGNKISKIPSQRMRNLARAISFLGNDETHYSKQHPEHDINSIKAFIRALISEIQNDIEYKKAEALINKPRP